jgi:hypothetical protein
MCINPGVLPSGLKIGCKECWQCQSVLVNDWLGRIKTETKEASWFVRLDLTYRPGADGKDPASAVVLSYRDVQNFLKRLRKAGYNVRYLVAGEYGSRKGRAHWHMLLWGAGSDPYENFAERKEKQECKYWQNGFVYLTRPTEDVQIKYVVKYALKDRYAKHGVMTEPLRMSTQPIIGRKFIRDLAADYVSQGLVPQDDRYELDGQIHKLRGRAAQIFLEDFQELWCKERGTLPGSSEYLEAYQDKIARDQDVELRMQFEHRSATEKPEAPYKQSPVFWDEMLRLWATVNPVVGFIEVFKQNSEGEWRWLPTKSGGVVAAAYRKTARAHQERARKSKGVRPISRG